MNDEKGTILRTRSAFYPRLVHIDCSFKRANFSYSQKVNIRSEKLERAVFTFRIVNMLTRVDFRGKIKARIVFVSMFTIE